MTRSMRFVWGFEHRENAEDCVAALRALGDKATVEHDPASDTLPWDLFVLCNDETFGHYAGFVQGFAYARGKDGY